MNKVARFLTKEDLVKGHCYSYDEWDSIIYLGTKLVRVPNFAQQEYQFLNLRTMNLYSWSDHGLQYFLTFIRVL